ncbi:MAG: carbohydrate ABC transporter permease [Ilumatobacter sp.]|uniref:carbohydrate ABC transporter permease n=1 Tax=Ilumatobacter sp. TaxID=1967498 RepID=UPI00391B2D81
MSKPIRASGRQLGVSAAVSIVGVLFALPFIAMFASSFRRSSDVREQPLNPLHGGLTLENYRQVWRETDVVAYFVNSAITTTSIVVLQVILAVGAAYSLGHLQPWGHRYLRAVIVVVLSIPVPAIAISNYLALARFDLIDTRASLVIPFVATAFGVFLLTQYVEAVPVQQIDAARAFGLGPWRRFRLVFLPNIRPGVAALAAFSFVGWWNEFFWPFIVLRTDRLATVPFLVRRFEISPTGLPDWGPLMAAATITLIPVAGLLVLLQRSFAQTLRFTAN